VQRYLDLYLKIDFLFWDQRISDAWYESFSLADNRPK